MLGTGMMPPQTGQGKRGSMMNGQNPDAKPGSGLLERQLGKGAETSLELAGQNPEAAAQQAEQIVKDKSQNFTQRELEELVDATIKAIQEIDSGPNANPTPIAREVLSIATPFAEEADRLAMETSAKIQEVLSNNSGSTQNPNKSPLGFFGPNNPSKQNPQGPVLAA